jgi:hypothetical protein
MSDVDVVVTDADGAASSTLVAASELGVQIVTAS